MGKGLTEHYLKKELYQRINKDNTLLDFIQEGFWDGVWYRNLETIEDEWLSPRFWEVLGYDPKDKEHKSSEWKDIIFKDDLKQVTEIFDKYIQDPTQPLDYIVRYKHKNGSTIWIRCRGIAIKDASGKVIRMLGAHTDITSFKQQEATFITMEKEKLSAELIIANKELAFQNKEKKKRAAELVIANKELAIQNEAKEKRAAELIIANKELAFQNEAKEKRESELIIANKELAFQNEAKENRAAELIIANKELAFQSEEKEKRAAELIIANKELAFQNEAKEKRAAELIVANKELALQNEAKEKRAAELIIANKELAFQNKEKKKRAAELVIANKELAYQNKIKEKRAAELIVANKELAIQSEAKENRATELIIANKELAYQNEAKENRAAELIIANKELAYQNKEKKNRASELVIANKELAYQNKIKEKRAAELIVANNELAIQSEAKENRAAELIIANKELAYQNKAKKKRAAELVIANKELAYQNKIKEKRAAELIVANNELAIQSEAKEKRAAELIVANKELAFQNKEKKKRAAELVIANKKISIENEKNEYLGYHDYLTNLYNRRYFVHAFTKKGYFPHGLMMIDINGLKIINDAYGHVRGDEAIRQVANLLMKVFDKEDVVARIGGDEFAILAPHKNAIQLQDYKDKLVSLSQNIKIDNIPVSLAIGFEALNDNDNDIDELLSRAEKQLYRHKITVGESIRNHAIKAILNTLTDKYKEEKTHSARVSQICKQIGTELGLSKEEVDVLELAGMYHDIGKISIPDAILKKPDKLTDEEYEIIKTHTQIGYKILRAADEYSGLAEYALSHHERWDGRGYPKGLKGEDIPLFSRIINVADSFEAMTADRPYRKGMSITDAGLEIKNCSGSQFDPGISNLFLTKVLQRVQ